MSGKTILMIDMGSESILVSDIDINTKFLHKFSLQCVLGMFSKVNLSTGKFPFVGFKLGIRKSLCDQDLSTVLDNRCGHKERSSFHCLVNEG